jgi:hypothetical protein
VPYFDVAEGAAAAEGLLAGVAGGFLTVGAGAEESTAETVGGATTLGGGAGTAPGFFCPTSGSESTEMVGVPECDAAGADLTVVGAWVEAEGAGVTVALGELEAMR